MQEKRKCLYNFFRTLKCRNFKQIYGQLICPNLDEYASIGDAVSSENLFFQVFYGNSGFLPGLFMKRPDAWDRGMGTHMGTNFI